MSANFIFQPKPTGDRYVQVHISYKQITDGKESTAALLSVLEYLAKQSLLHTESWSIGDPIPVSIPIEGDCNNPRLNRLLGGWLKPTALREKLHELETLGLISLDTRTNNRRRFVIYHHGAIATALADVERHPAKSETSKNVSSESVALQGSATENGGFSPPSDSEGSRKCGPTSQKVEGAPSESEDLEALRHQKVRPSRSISTLEEQKEEISCSVSPSKEIPTAASPLPLSSPSQNVMLETVTPIPTPTSQSDFELLSPVQQQAFRLSGVAIALDPWMVDNAVNQANVLSGRAFRCEFDGGFTDYLWHQLCKSPYWQKRSDEPATNAGIRIIKGLYAIADPAVRSAERERLDGEWDKYQQVVSQRERNEQLRSMASRMERSAEQQQKVYVPLSQMPFDIQSLFARFKRPVVASAG